MTFKTNKQRKAAFARMNSGLHGKSKHGWCELNIQFPYTDNPFLYNTHEHENHISNVKTSEQTKNLPIKNLPQNLSGISKSNARKKDPEIFNFFRKATLSFLATSMLGVPISTTVEDAVFHSIEDSYRAYKKTNEINDAVSVGIESFVKTYVKNYTFDYLQKNMQKTDDDIFDEVLEGIILISTTIISGGMVD